MVVGRNTAYRHKNKAYLHMAPVHLGGRKRRALHHANALCSINASATRTSVSTAEKGIGDQLAKQAPCQHSLQNKHKRSHNQFREYIGRQTSKSINADGDGETS